MRPRLFVPGGSPGTVNSAGASGRVRLPNSVLINLSKIDGLGRAWTSREGMEE